VRPERINDRALTTLRLRLLLLDSTNQVRIALLLVRVQSSLELLIVVEVARTRALGRLGLGRHGLTLALDAPELPTLGLVSEHRPERLGVPLELGLTLPLVLEVPLVQTPDPGNVLLLLRREALQAFTHVLGQRLKHGMQGGLGLLDLLGRVGLLRLLHFPRIALCSRLVACLLGRLCLGLLALDRRGRRILQLAHRLRQRLLGDQRDCGLLRHSASPSAQTIRATRRAYHT